MGKKVSTKLRFKNQGDIEVVKNCASYINMDLSNYATRAVYEFTKAILEQRKQHAAASKAKAEADAKTTGGDASGNTEATPGSQDAPASILAKPEAVPAEGSDTEGQTTQG